MDTKLKKKCSLYGSCKHLQEEDNDDYLTPSQRKDKMLKDLKKELKVKAELITLLFKVIISFLYVTLLH